MSINNREEANRYYGMINGLVDKYLVENKIRPSKLRQYLKPGGDKFNKFLQRNKLDEIPGADTVLKDIIEDRESMEKDGVIKFESFKMFESEEYKISSLKQCLYKGIDNATSKMEKIIADHFDTNLGDIDIVDAGKHIFKINDWQNSDRNVIIYSEEEIDIIKGNIIEHLYGELSKKKIELNKYITVDLSDLIKINEFTEKILREVDDKFKDVIKEILGDYDFKDEVSGYFIWIS